MRKIGSRGQAEMGGMMAVQMIIILILFVLSIFMENPRALFWGSKLDIDVQPGRKVVYVQPHLFQNFWVMTRPMGPEEEPEVIVLKEKSWFGIFQGTIILRENRR